jgi:hypothetical protein
VSGHAKMPPASHQVSATSLKLLIQQIHPHVRVERGSGMCVACDLYYSVLYELHFISTKTIPGAIENLMSLP